MIVTLGLQCCRFGTDLDADRVRHLGYQVEDAGNVLRVTLRPEVLVITGVDQLNGQADLAAFPQQAALYQGVDAEFAGDVGGRQRAVAIAQGRLPGNDLQAGMLRELRDQKVLQTVGVVVLLRIAGQVLQRQHGERSDVRRRRGLLRREEPVQGQASQHDGRENGRQDLSAGGSRRLLAHGRLGPVLPFEFLHGSDKTVALGAHGFEVTVGGGIISQRLAQAGHGLGQRRLADHRVAPYVIHQFLAGHQPVAVVDKVNQESQNDRVEMNLRSVMGEPPGLGIQLEVTETAEARSVHRPS